MSKDLERIRPHVEAELERVVQMNLLEDTKLAELERRHGMGNALTADRAREWKAAATLWLRHRPSGFLFTADDLVREIGLPDEGVNRNNVVGAWLAAQSRAGRIVFTGRFHKSKRVVRHGNQQRVWKVV